VLPGAGSRQADLALREWDLDTGLLERFVNQNGQVAPDLQKRVGCGEVQARSEKFKLLSPKPRTATLGRVFENVGMPFRDRLE